VKKTTLCFFIKEGWVLLAMKKRGFGEGKWNGVGGKLKEHETAREAILREIKEEIGVDVAGEDLKNAGTLRFRYDGKPEWDQVCEVFTTGVWKGEPAESEEMRPRWYPIGELPFEAMWIDDPYWLPKVLAGKTVDGEFLFDRAGATILSISIS
jgi:ADP-ribose pyrophosphatase YjhB (NUDIX family)